MDVTERKVIAVEAIVVAAVVATALLLQLLAGSFPVEVFAFPLNVIILALWVFVAYILHTNREKSVVAKSLLSMRATWLSLGSMVTVGLYLGLQREPNAASWLVVVAILFTLTHLLLITMRGWRTSRGIRWRFTLLHAGLIIALGAGFWGAPDRVQLRSILTAKGPTTQAYHLNRTASNLGYTMQLQEFEVEYSSNGTPTHFEAVAEIDNETVTLTVNHPYHRTFSEKIYLVSINSQEEYCIVEIVREPWQWASLAGIVLLLAGAVMLFVRGPRHNANKLIK